MIDGESLTSYVSPSAEQDPCDPVIQFSFMNMYEKHMCHRSEPWQPHPGMDRRRELGPT
jgi:hypothetical protein